MYPSKSGVVWLCLFVWIVCLCVGVFVDFLVGLLVLFSILIGGRGLYYKSDLIFQSNSMLDKGSLKKIPLNPWFFLLLAPNLVIGL